MGDILKYDRTANLFNATIVQGSFTADGGVNSANTRVRSEFQSIPLESGTYTISAVGMDYALHAAYTSPDLATFDGSESGINSWNALPYTFTITQRRYICFAFRKSDNSRIYPTDISDIMLNTGSTALPYQPYYDWQHSLKKFDGTAWQNATVHEF